MGGGLNGAGHWRPTAQYPFLFCCRTRVAAPQPAERMPADCAAAAAASAVKGGARASIYYWTEMRVVCGAHTPAEQGGHALKSRSEGALRPALLAAGWGWCEGDEGALAPFRLGAQCAASREAGRRAKALLALRPTVWGWRAPRYVRELVGS